MSYLSNILGITQYSYSYRYFCKEVNRPAMSVSCAISSIPSPARIARMRSPVVNPLSRLFSYEDITFLSPFRLRG